MSESPQQDTLKEIKSNWTKKYEASRKRDALFTTVSRRTRRSLNIPSPDPYSDFDEKMGMPGQYPFLRGIHPTDTEAGSGQCACFPASAPPRRPTPGSNSSLARVRRA